MEKKKIVFADDLESFRRLGESFFCRQECELLQAIDGEEALATIRAERPALVFLDARLPPTDGCDCCRRIKNDPQLAAIPVVLIAHSDGAKEMEKYRRAGADEVLPWPIDGPQLAEIARRFLQLFPRTAPRVEARLRVRYGAGAQEVLTDYSVNLSTGGLFLETSDPLPLETPLRLSFELSEGDRTIHCRGRVAWINTPEHPFKPQLPSGMGVQFIDLTLADLEALRTFVQQKSVYSSW